MNVSIVRENCRVGNFDVNLQSREKRRVRTRRGFRQFVSMISPENAREKKE